jgi:RNA polymerase sigma-70 factor, ECF subfamily
VPTSANSRSASELPTSSFAAKERLANSARAAARDSALVARFRAGEETAFTEIVSHYHERIFMMALYQLRNRADAEEIAQDTFIRAHRGLVRFRGDSSLATWLHRIVFNLSQNRRKYYKCRKQDVTFSLNCPPGLESQVTLGDLIPSDMPGPAREVTAREYFELVKICMAKLPSEQFTILCMRTSLDKSYEEIAATLRLKIGTVKSRIGRARERLRMLLSEDYPDLQEGSSDSV